MRLGQNPAKFVGQVAQPERITVAVLTYIPFLSGFYSETLDVLKLSLKSLRENAGLPFDLMVFDNGSCKEARDYLLESQHAGSIQYLILSEKNMGKGGAWNVIFGAAPGEILAYGDSDILYFPGWLSKSVVLLESFPNVGMVTSRPFRTNEEFYTKTVEWAQNTPGVKLEEGQLIPWEDFLEFDLSLGQTEAEIRQHYAATCDFRLSYKDQVAFAGASHWQFIAYKSVLQQFMPFQMDRPMGQVKQLDLRMNEAGCLRLMTSQPLVMNMSNTLQKATDRTAAQVSKAKGSRFLDFPLVKRPLLGLYDRIFRWYYAR